MTQINSIKRAAGVLVVSALIFGASFSSLVLLPGNYVHADPTDSMQEGADAAKGDDTPVCMFTHTTDSDGEALPESDPDYCASGVFTNIVNALLFVIGAVSVLMLVYGGIRYAISGGDQASVTAAKNTILYAVIGIIVAVMAYAIVNFVVTSIT